MGTDRGRKDCTPSPRRALDLWDWRDRRKLGENRFDSNGDPVERVRPEDRVLRW
jgi:hypothetical protein